MMTSPFALFFFEICLIFHMHVPFLQWFYLLVVGVLIVVTGVLACSLMYMAIITWCYIQYMFYPYIVYYYRCPIYVFLVVSVSPTIIPCIFAAGFSGVFPCPCFLDCCYIYVTIV